MDLKLRCSASGCDCINFVAATTKDSLRVCDGCSHSWMTHLLEKLLTSRDDALSIFDVCSLALYGTHALPIRLKIVIERLLATLQPDEVDKILRSFGWTPQDLARGYMIQDPRGGLLVRWSMPPRDEEILILQQFLRFQATRALSFALLRDDFPLMSPAAAVSLPNNSFTSLFHPSLLNIPTTNQPSTNNNNNPLHSNNNNNSTTSNNTNNNLSSNSSSNNSMLSPKSPVNHNNNNNSISGLTPGSLFSLNNSHLNLGIPHFLANSGINSSPSSSHNPAVSLANHNSSNNNHSSNNNSINNNNNNNTSPNTRNHHHQNDRHVERISGGSALPAISTSSIGDRSRSRSGRRSTNSSALNLSVQSESDEDEMKLSTNNHATTDSGGRKSSIMLNEVVDLSSSASTSINNTKSQRRGNHNSNNDTGHGHPGGSMGSHSHGIMGNHHNLHHSLKSGEILENHSGGGNHIPRGDQLQHLRNNHLSMSNELINNLTNMHKSADLMAAAAAAAAAVSMPPNSMTSSAPALGPHSRKSGQPIKRGWNPVPMAAQLVNPATMTAQGKRRVQCSVCLKTFCDKGALKIHFSAVHLREMHKCTVAGCNMMFSSRRSRNRHSANPNPKLHSPHLRRKISPHDGRSSQPLLNLNNPMLFPGSNMRFPPFMPGLGMPPQNGGMGVPSESGKDDKSSDDDTLDMKHQVKMDSDMMMDPDGSNSEASYSSANEEFLEPKSPPSNSSSKKDGARKRKLNNPVRLSNVADDSNDEFCCYDDGTVVSNEDDDIEDNDNEIDKFKGGGSSNGSPKKDGSRASPPSDVQSPLSLTGHNHAINNTTSPNNGDFNEEKFLNQKSGILTHPAYSDNDKLGTIRPEDGDSETKRQNFIKEERHEINSREISDDNHNHSEEKANDKKRNIKSEKSSEDEEADHLGKLEALPIFSSPHNSDSSMKSEDDENNGGRSGGSPNSNGDIPIDPDNPRRCLVCGKVFQNHFGVKTHYQNVHLKLMHKCTVDGCNAAFPSKRSRDRHSSNLNLHRKLLSTSDNSNGSSTDCSLKDRGMPLTPGVSPAPTGGPTFFNPYLFQNGSGPPALGLPTQALSPPMANPSQWNPFLPFHMFPAVFGAPPPGIPKDAPSIVDCRFCGKSFEEGASIKNHMELSHPDEIFRCRCCSSVFYSRKKFESHSKACVE